MPAEPARVLLAATGDLALRRRLDRLAAEHGLVLAAAGPATGPDGPGGMPAADGPGGMPAADGPGGMPAADGQPAVAVIDLHRVDALDLVREWRARWPGTVLAGYLDVPDRDRWIAAQRAGCDLVVNRGALVVRLRGLLARDPAPAARLFPLFGAADAAGRLGLVHRAEDTPAGPVAVYRAGGRLCAVADRCPHAGAVLSGGELDGTVITCPRHGSRFDVCTGDRVRGPADTGLAVFPLTEQNGQVFLLVQPMRPG